MTDPDVLHWDTFDQWIQTHYRPPDDEMQGNRKHEGRLGVRQIAEITGFGSTTISNWSRLGVLPPHVADRLAVSIGQHPATIWRNWWALAFDDEGAA